MSSLGPRLTAFSKDEIMNALKITYHKIKKNKTGKVASYIPGLKKEDNDIFGISIVTADGDIYEIGDSAKKIAIESIAKVFVLCLALEEHGSDVLIDKIGVSQSFLPFNSILASELISSHTINPFVNAGAMATTSLIKGENRFAIWNKIYFMMNRFAGHRLDVSDSLYESESKTNNINKALCYLLKAHNRFYGPIDTVLDVYTRQGSVLISSTELATMGSTLANCGRNPYTGEQVINNDNVSYVLSTMMSDGLYNYSGHWINSVGLPGKSGVGGGILAIVPGRFAIAVTSPKLDKYGNSVRGVKACQMLSSLLGLSIFNPNVICTERYKQFVDSKKDKIKKKLSDITTQKGFKTVKKFYKVDKDLIKKGSKHKNIKSEVPIIKQIDKEDLKTKKKKIKKVIKKKGKKKTKKKVKK